MHPVYYRQDAGIAFTQLSKNGFFAASGETTDQIKKIRGCKNGTALLYHHAKYDGDRGSRAGCIDEKVSFLLFLSRVSILTRDIDIANLSVCSLRSGTR